MNLKDKVIIITGGTRGIGLAIAKNCASYGAIVVVSSTKQEKCNEIAKMLAKEYNVKTLGVASDISNIDSAQNLIKTTLDTFEKIDVLVNNAGITRDNLLLRMKPEEWSQVIDTNLTSVFNMTKSVLRPMLKKKQGKIINISSVVGIIGNAGQANYAASKAGIIGFSKSIAKEVGSKGITCNVVAPGFIETDMIEALPEDYINNIIQGIPLRRLGQSTEVANVVTFLASDLANYITGETISVDGGIQM